MLELLDSNHYQGAMMDSSEGSPSEPEDLPCQQAWYESDLQLAAELGKTLLERNKELETNLKLEQSVIEDQALEIEYLCKQSIALREVNESRLKVYEQLEISIQDLEKSNQQLESRANVDKKKIKSLNNTVDILEKKCEELQTAVEDLRATTRQNQLQKRRERRRTLGLGMEFDAAELRRVLSVENGFGESTDVHCTGGRWNLDKETELLKLQNAVRELKTQKGREQRLREDLELEVAQAMQENLQLRDQLTVLQQREVVMKALQMELQEMEEQFNSQKFCRHCHRELEGSSRTEETILEREHEVDDQPTQPMEQCAVVKLPNGGLAYGNQETLVSVGDIVVGDHDDVDATERRVKDSLLSELDTQYRLLIEKYESMVNARRIAETTMERTDRSRRRSDGGSSPEVESFSSEEKDYEPYRVDDGVGWVHHGAEEASSMSSGFSDGEAVGVAHKSVQTDFRSVKPETVTVANSPLGQSMSAEAAVNAFSGLRSSGGRVGAGPNPVESHFSRMPEYKKIFQEIFAVLKKSVQKSSIHQQPDAEQIEMTEAFPALSRADNEVDSRSSRQASYRERSYADVLSTTALVGK